MFQQRDEKSRSFKDGGMNDFKTAPPFFYHGNSFVSLFQKGEWPQDH